ncbi:hypothetical protein BpHYR1_016680, partial [Brachionus plicatilis]
VPFNFFNFDCLGDSQFAGRWISNLSHRSSELFKCLISSAKNCTLLSVLFLAIRYKFKIDIKY